MKTTKINVPRATETIGELIEQASVYRQHGVVFIETEYQDLWQEDRAWGQRGDAIEIDGELEQLSQAPPGRYRKITVRPGTNPLYLLIR